MGSPLLLALCLAFGSVQDASPFAIYKGGASQRQQCSKLASSIATISSSRTRDEEDDNVEGENIMMPKTGISVSDAIDEARVDRFETKIKKIDGLPGVFQLVTHPVHSISVEPVRYLIETTATDVVMMDVPPYSIELADEIRANGRSLRAILMTTRNAVHYDQAPTMYSMTRRADLDQWIQAFPEVSVIGYRLDVPRDCRFAMSQILDGYGPFAFDGNDGTNVTFVETGRPLTRSERNETMAADFMSGRIPPAQTVKEDKDNELYSAEAIRRREEGKSILAIYTPGHTFGAMSYVFPRLGICCTGYTVPCDDNRVTEDTRGIGSPPGPSLDYRGYITTTQDSRRQMKSAEHLVKTYVDRFAVVLPSYGEPVFLQDDVEDRRETLLLLLDHYHKIGEEYRQLDYAIPEDAEAFLLRKYGCLWDTR